MHIPSFHPKRRERLLRILLAVFLLLAVLAAPACDEEEEEPTADEWVERGKEKLSDGDGAGAYIAFQEALDVEEGNMEARYGVILADVLQFVDTVGLLQELINTPTTSEFPPDVAAQVCERIDECGLLDALRISFAECVEGGSALVGEDTIACILDAPDCDVMTDRCLGLLLPPSREQCSAACVEFASCGYYLDTTWQVADCVAECENLYLGLELDCFVTLDGCGEARDTCFAFFGETLSLLVEEFWLPIGEEMGFNVSEVRQHEGFRFEHDSYTVTLIDPFLKPVFSGVHDVSDVYFFASIYAAMDGLFSAALALDLDLNPLILAELGLDELGTQLGLFSLDKEGDQDAAAILAQLDNLLNRVLGDPVYSRFLRLRGAEGDAYMRWAGAQLGWVFGYLAQMIESVAAETDDQSDDVIRYVDQNADGVWNDPEPLIVPGVAELDYELAWILHDLFLALKVDFTDGYPFRFEQLVPLFDYLDWSELSFIIKVLDASGVDSIDLGQAFREPDPDGLRPLLVQLQTLLQTSQQALKERENIEP
ncbi:MAG: hypothetical protein P9L99_18130 [Candidatus Lernaella stagnicola]|nr:hypothetical protein [Candidatus Lernaella stagnicola]